MWAFIVPFFALTLLCLFLYTQWKCGNIDQWKTLKNSESERMGVNRIIALFIHLDIVESVLYICLLA